MKFRSFARIICLVCGMLLIASCGLSSSSPTPATIPSASVSPSPPPTSGPAMIATASLPTATQRPAATQPTRQPSATRLLHPTPTPTETLSVLDISAQQAALLPQAHAVLREADRWDQYVITATLQPATQTVSGTMQLLVTNHTSTTLRELSFHLYPNHSDFGTGSLWVSDVVAVDGRAVEVTTEQDDVLLRVPLPAPLAPRDSATVAMAFRVRTPQQSSDSAYGAFNQEAGVWALASFYPVLARFTRDGWDHRPITASAGDLAVTETALYDVTLDSPTDWQLVTTGSRIAQTELSDGMQRKRFVSGPQRDFFVAAVQGLEQQSLTVDDTHIISYYQPGNPFTGEQSLEVAARAWQCFRQRYGSNPLQEVEIIQAALTGFIGVEYPGVMLIEQTLYWENDEVLESTVAHEISHQWWYNLVGNDARRDPWIDEGLASFSQIVYDECMGNKAHATSTFLHYQKQYRQAEQAGRGGPINQSVEALQGKYYSIAYARSALFFTALRAQLGNETFYQFLRRYAEEYRYRVASGDDLLAMAEATCNCDLQAFADEWMER